MLQKIFQLKLQISLLCQNFLNNIKNLSLTFNGHFFHGIIFGTNHENIIFSDPQKKYWVPLLIFLQVYFIIIKWLFIEQEVN